MINQDEDAKVIIGFLAVANGIALVGFVCEYSLLSLALTTIGLAGLLVIAFFLLYVVLLLVEYLAGNEDELG